MWSPFVPLLLAYIHSAMTHLQQDIQGDAIKFLAEFLAFLPELILPHARQVSQSLRTYLERSLCVTQQQKIIKVKFIDKEAPLLRCFLQLSEGLLQSWREECTQEKASLISTPILAWSMHPGPKVAYSITIVSHVLMAILYRCLLVH